MDMYELLGKKSPEQVSLELASNFKKIRKMKGITQKNLSKMSLVPYGTIRNFEQKGKISLNTLIVLAQTLGIADDFNLLFNPLKHKSYEDMINENRRH